MDEPPAFLNTLRAYGGHANTVLGIRLLLLTGVCSGLMKPDTHLGENARQIEVSDDQTTSFFFR